MLTLFMAISDGKLCRAEDVSDVFYSDNIITADNIPYSIRVYRIGKWAYCVPNFHDVDDSLFVVVDDNCTDREKFEEVFFTLESCTYVAGQQNPNLIFEDGGDCQAFAIFLYHNLKRLGVPVGMIPGENHVYNWVKIDGILYKVDLTTNEVSRLSLIDREKIRSLVGEDAE